MIQSTAVIGCDFPHDVGTRPVLVELEYQLSDQPGRSTWPAPRLLDGGVVLQTLWEVRLAAQVRPCSAFHAAGPMKISGTGPATCGSGAPGKTRRRSTGGLPAPPAGRR